MAHVVLFHHAQGLTPGVVAFADQLRRAGHTVDTPDLFGGRTFDSIEAGMAYVEEVGFPGIIERGARAVRELPAELVYAGFSLGVVPAQMLAQTRPGARGALFFYSCVPVEEFGEAWPDDVPVQVHGMDADPIFVGEGDLDAARALVAQAKDGELYLYPGDTHYFADSSLPSYDPDASALLTRRVLDFLAGHVSRHDPMPDRVRPQVRLVPATVSLLDALAQDRARFGELIGSPVPDGWPEFPEAIAFTLEHLRTAPEPDHVWSMQFFVDSATGRLVGSGGFAAPPVDRTVEIGYEVAPEFRGQGFGTAAARALVERAMAVGEVDHVIAHTLPGPNPSTGVLVSLGFEHVADQDDPEVGTVSEWRWPGQQAL